MLLAARAVERAIKAQEVIVRALRCSVFCSIHLSSGSGSPPSSPPCTGQRIGNTKAPRSVPAPLRAPAPAPRPQAITSPAPPAAPSLERQAQQTDFTHLKVVGWGWYYLSTVLDDYSRYILAWTLTTTMQASDVTTTLDFARAKAGVDEIRVLHRPRLLSDNGPCYVSSALGAYLTQHGMTHTRGAPYHPMTPGKIERYHRSMKNVVKLDVYHSPWELARPIERFVEYYNHRRLHDSLQNVTPADVYEGRQVAILDRRARIKRETLRRRKRENLCAA